MIIKNHHWIALTGISLSLLILNMSPAAAILTPRQMLSAGLILCAIIVFATSALPEYITALLLMTGAMLLEVAPASVVFSGFYSTACWLIFSGLVIGIALKKTKLTQRLAGLFGQRVTASYWRIIAATVSISTLVGFLMPSSLGRAVLLVPIAMAIADKCSFSQQSNGRIGIALAVAFGCHVPTFAVLPANVPNMVMIGAAEASYDWVPAYAHYLLLHFPVLGLLKALLIIGLIVWLYPDRPKQQTNISKQTAFSKQEYQLILVLAITLCFWMTDTLHNISAAWIGLTTACLLLMPGIGIIEKREFNSQFNIASLIFVVGILSLGAIINDSGLSQLLGDQFSTWLPLSVKTPFINFMALSLTAAATAIFTTLPGVPIVLTPFAESMSISSGFSIEAVIMTQVLGFSTIVFPFQSAPLVVAMQLAGVSLKHAAKLCLILTAITITILFPLDYLWWSLIDEIN